MKYMSKRKELSDREFIAYLREDIPCGRKEGLGEFCGDGTGILCSACVLSLEIADRMEKLLK